MRKIYARNFLLLPPSLILLFIVSFGPAVLMETATPLPHLHQAQLLKYPPPLFVTFPARQTVSHSLRRWDSLSLPYPATHRRRGRRSFPRKETWAGAQSTGQLLTVSAVSRWRGPRSRANILPLYLSTFATASRPPTARACTTLQMSTSTNQTRSL